jgi:hypothetical protein
MTNQSEFHLGRKAVRTDRRTLRFGDYLAPGLPPPPRAVDWTRGITGWGVGMNHALNICTISAAAHAVKVWTANCGGLEGVSDAAIEDHYERWAGYGAGDYDSDLGGVALDVLKAWRKSDFDGHELAAFADANPANLDEIRRSIALFGGVYAGLALPLSCRYQDVWDVVPDGGAFAKRGSWGGHCVFVPKYDEKGFTCIAWGRLKAMTAAFWLAYCDEAHTLFSREWMSHKGVPKGFRMDRLMADLAAIE